MYSISLNQNREIENQDEKEFNLDILIGWIFFCFKETPISLNQNRKAENQDEKEFNIDILIEWIFFCFKVTPISLNQNRKKENNLKILSNKISEGFCYKTPSDPAQKYFNIYIYIY